MCLIFEQYLTLSPQKKSRINQESHKNLISRVCHFSHLKRILVGLTDMTLENYKLWSSNALRIY